MTRSKILLGGTFLLIAGFTLGWLSKPSPFPTVRDDAVGQHLQAKSHNQVESAVKTSVADGDVRRISLLAEEVQRLSPHEFAVRLHNLMREGLSSMEIAERSILSVLATSEQAAACYLRHRKEAGLESSLESVAWKEFLQMAGRKNGVEFMRAIQAQVNGKLEGVDSILHGFAFSHPQKAVDWFNSMEESHPSRATALRGMLWGLTQTHADTAITVFNSLDPEDKSIHAISGFANALIACHGFAGLDKWMATKPPANEIEELVKSGIHRAERRHPSELAEWSARHVSELPFLAQINANASGRWVAEDSAAAMAWTQAQVQDSQSNASLEGMVRALVKAGKEQELKNWLQANPNISKADALSGLLEKKS